MSEPLFGPPLEARPALNSLIELLKTRAQRYNQESLVPQLTTGPYDRYRLKSLITTYRDVVITLLTQSLDPTLPEHGQLRPYRYSGSGPALEALLEAIDVDPGAFLCRPPRRVMRREIIDAISTAADYYLQYPTPVFTPAGGHNRFTYDGEMIWTDGDTTETKSYHMVCCTNVHRWTLPLVPMVYISVLMDTACYTNWLYPL